MRQVARICMDYGTRVQHSVFECVVTEAQLEVIKQKILSVIQDTQDSVRLYVLGNHWQGKVVVLGKDNGTDVTGELIV